MNCARTKRHSLIHHRYPQHSTLARPRPPCVALNAPENGLATWGGWTRDFDVENLAARIKAARQAYVVCLFVLTAVRAVDDMPRDQLVVLAAVALPRAGYSLFW